MVCTFWPYKEGKLHGSAGAVRLGQQLWPLKLSLCNRLRTGFFNTVTTMPRVQCCIYSVSKIVSAWDVSIPRSSTHNRLHLCLSVFNFFVFCFCAQFFCSLSLVVCCCDSRPFWDPAPFQAGFEETRRRSAVLRLLHSQGALLYFNGDVTLPMVGADVHCTFVMLQQTI